MSRHRIIAAVTAAIGQRVQAAIEAAIPGSFLSFERPDSSATDSTVYVFMYQAVPNPSARNMELPVRYPGGSAKQKPLLPLNLNYFISFIGDESKLEAQKMLGSVASMFHAYPVIAPEDIRSAALLGVPLLDPNDDGIPVTSVRLTPQSLSLDELSKIWSVFFQTPYILSIGYQASMALLEHEVAIRPPLPAQRPRGKAGMLANPVIDRIISQDGEYQPITVDSSLLILGRRLSGEQTLVYFLEADDVSVPDTASESAVAVALPATVQTVGVHTVRVLHRPWDALPGDASDETRSNTGSFVVHPKVTGWSVTGSLLDVQLAPPARKGQKIRVLLDELDSESPACHQIPVDPFTGDSTTSVRCDLTDVTPGSYALRISIDDIDSRIDIDLSSQTISPSLTLP